MRRLRADAVIALVLLAAGGFVLNDLLQTEGTGAFVKNTTLPIALVVFLMVLSLVLLAQSMLQPAPAAPVPEETHSDAAEADEATAGGGEIRHYLRVAATVGWIILYVLSLPWFGYLASSIVFLAGASFIYGNRNPIVIAAISIILPVALLLFFEKFMVVLLPSSRLFG